VLRCQAWIRTTWRRLCCVRWTRRRTGPVEMLAVVWWACYSSWRRPHPRPSCSTTTCPPSTWWAGWRGQTPASWVHSVTYGVCWTPEQKWWAFSPSDRHAERFISVLLILNIELQTFYNSLESTNFQTCTDSFPCNVFCSLLQLAYRASIPYSAHPSEVIDFMQWQLRENQTGLSACSCSIRDYTKASKAAVTAKTQCQN